MPLGIVSDEEFDAECAHISIERGRGTVKEVPEAIREIIAEDAITGDGSIAEVAEKFGVSSASVSAYKNGATSTASYNQPDKKLKSANDVVRNSIISTARARLIAALDNITPEKMAEAKLRDVASVAKDMSSIITNMEPQVSHGGVNAQFIFHVPKSKTESDFEIIDVTQ